jgi:lipopolysaccharide export system permease protein
MDVFELIDRIKNTTAGELSYRQIAIELNKKMTIPISCIVFGILGIPLGIKPTRAVKSRGFVVGILTVLVYYLAQITGDALVETGRLAPIVGTWAPIVFFSILSVYLLIRTAHEKPLPVRIPNLLKSILPRKR